MVLSQDGVRFLFWCWGSKGGAVVIALALLQCYPGCRTGEVTRTPGGFSMDTLVFNFFEIRPGMVEK